ncbi:MAG: peptidylprolyl isomerase [Hyphomicrobium sp.]
MTLLQTASPQCASGALRAGWTAGARARVGVVLVAAIALTSSAARMAAAEDTEAPAMKPTTSETAPARKAAQPAAKSAKKSAAPAPDAAATPADTGRPPTRTAARSGGTGGEQAIIALVNDEPVTGFEVQQRAVMLGGGSIQTKAQENFKALIKSPKTSEKLKAILAEVIKANPGKSKDELLGIFEGRKKQFAMSLQKQAVDSARSSALPGVRKTALEEIIDEKLKMQEAKRLGAIVGEDEVDKVIDGIAERNKMSKDQLAGQLGGSLEPMKLRVRSTLSWNEVIRRKFGQQISIATKDVDKFVASAQGAGEDQVELQVQRIRLAIPVKVEQAAIAQRVADAETIRGRFKDCRSTQQIISGVAGAKFDELGKRRPAAFPEPTRTMLLNAQDNEMLPPSVGEGGVELFAVCGRNVVKAEIQQRSQAEGELKQKEFELMAKKHLKDLRQDAHIEYR